MAIGADLEMALGIDMLRDGEGEKSTDVRPRTSGLFRRSSDNCLVGPIYGRELVRPGYSVLGSARPLPPI